MHCTTFQRPVQCSKTMVWSWPFSKSYNTVDSLYCDCTLVCLGFFFFLSFVCFTPWFRTTHGLFWITLPACNSNNSLWNSSSINNKASRTFKLRPRRTRITISIRTFCPVCFGNGHMPMARYYMHAFSCSQQWSEFSAGRRNKSKELITCSRQRKFDQQFIQAGFDR